MAVGRNGDNSGVAVGLLYLSLLLSQRVCIVLVEGVGPGIGLGHFFRRVHGGLGAGALFDRAGVSGVPIRSMGGL